MLTFVDIVKRWAYEHYPIETLGMIELAVTLNEDGSPREVLLEGYQVQLSVASPTFFRDLEAALFRIWGLRACKKPFRTFVND